MRTTSLFLTAALLGTSAAASAAAPATITIPMHAENKSGENGTAVLKNTAKGVLITVTLKNAPASFDQPTHIHAGTCSKLNPAPEFPLASTHDGTSVSLYPGMTIAKLIAKHVSINVHKSTSDLATYVSCGEIK